MRLIVEFMELLLVGQIPRFFGVTRTRLGSVIRYSLIIFPILFSYLPSSHSLLLREGNKGNQETMIEHN